MTLLAILFNDLPVFPSNAPSFAPAASRFSPAGFPVCRVSPDSSVFPAVPLAAEDSWLSLFPQDHSLPRRELRLDIQIGDLLTPNKDVRRTFHDCRTALQFVPLACSRLIVDKDVAAAPGYPRRFVLLVAERRVLTGFREIHVFLISPRPPTMVANSINTGPAGNRSDAPALTRSIKPALLSVRVITAFPRAFASGTAFSAADSSRSVAISPHEGSPVGFQVLLRWGEGEG